MDPEDYQCCLDCFLRPDPGEDDKPAQQVGSDNMDDLIEQAEMLIKGGRFKYLELYRWDATDYEWTEVRTWP